MSNTKDSIRRIPECGEDPVDVMSIVRQSPVGGIENTEKLLIASSSIPTYESLFKSLASANPFIESMFSSSNKNALL